VTALLMLSTTSWITQGIRSRLPQHRAVSAFRDALYRRDKS
jgi:hypothetical protein